MKYTPEQIRTVRERSIAQELGIPIHGRKKMINCPMPGHNDSSPSFLVDDQNCYYCFGCGAKGCGFIDFITEFLRREGHDEERIFNQIMEEYGNRND